MRRSSIFWGVAIILAGVVLLLSNLGLLPVNAWNLIWPLALVLLGLWFLFAPRLARGSLETRDLALPLEGARSAQVRISYGAGRLDLGPSSIPGQLLSGSFEGGVRESVSRNGDQTSVRLENPEIPVPGVIAGRQGASWRVQVSPDVDLNLVLETGASENILDLGRLRVTNLEIKSGASSTDVTLPANAGSTRVKVESGAASVTLRVPPGVAARIKGESFLSGFEIDAARFPRVDGQHYESPDYATAVNRVDISAEMGVGSVKVF
ncbi:MAG TPA: DUF5668 domain-containing protein [Anaerolineaceae bacterium]